MMSGIRSSDTKLEILIRKALHRAGYRFRLGSKVGRVRPDVVLRSRNIPIFVHGCYWHQHSGCKLAYSNRKYSEEWQKNSPIIECVISELKSSYLQMAGGLLSSGSVQPAMPKFLLESSGDFKTGLKSKILEFSKRVISEYRKCDQYNQYYLVLMRKRGKPRSSLR